MHNILLIDSNEQSIDKIKGKIDWAYYGFIIQDAVMTIADGLSLINDKSYDLYLLNLTHLDIFGFKFCEQIRKQTANPILLIGGEKDFNLVRQAMNLRVNDYLPNPVANEELVDSIMKIKESIEEKKAKVLTYNTNQSQPKTASNIIDIVKDYVEQSIHENITLKEISDTLHYNASYLGQKFKCQEKMTFIQYLLEQRMEKAKYLLRFTDMKIYQIAYQVGYTDLDWFYKKFKSHTGVSASVYRETSSEEVVNQQHSI
ncbi:DNA-binding response regulator [Amphibacillus indicireducens]|uniref:Response regulator n=1 Tax=Amphibacillus indicireducens TaxID=1076330 RepID=A0ABP7VNC4_9BACI